MSIHEADRARLADLKVRIPIIHRSVDARRAAILQPDGIISQEIATAHIRESQCMLALTDEATRIKDRLDSYTYPVLTLPYEIVTEVFVHFLPPYPECTPLTGIFSPITLAHICTSWGQIAQATPQLWRAISISVRETGFKQQCHVLDMWLKQSLSWPISVAITEVHPDPTPRILSTLFPHRARLEHFDVYLTRFNLFTTNDWADGPMPLLRKIRRGRKVS